MVMLFPAMRNTEMHRQKPTNVRILQVSSGEVRSFRIF
jgi:hypothetical protein